MATFREMYGPWAIITGASSGIGSNFANQLAERGLNLILVARREDRLRELAVRLEKSFPIKTKVVVADLSRDDFGADIQRSTAGLDVGLLVNNAGFSNTGEFLENDVGSELKMLHVNCRAPLILAHEYGRKMKARRRGGIIFLSSMVAFTAVPLWSNYAATKSYALLLAEGLSHELEASGVDVLALCPGTTRTEFQEVAGTDAFMAMEPDKVVRFALNQLGRKKTAIPGFLNGLNVFSTRFLPRTWSAKIFGRVIKHMQRT